MELVPFLEKDFEQLISWITSERLNYQWGGPKYNFPLTRDQIMAHCSKPETFPFLFKVGGDNAGFIELRYQSEGQYRICRVLIAQEFRGMGLSTPMLKMAIEKATAEFECNTLTLAVFEHNLSARNCYLGLGFEEIAITQATRTFDDETWNSIEMAKSLV